MQETSLNLRPFFEIPLRWWRLVLSCVVLATLLTAMINFIPVLTPDLYEAVAGVAVVKSRTLVSFDETARTLSEEQLIASLQAGQRADTIVSDLDARRQTLVALVNNGTIAEQVLDQLQEELTPRDRQPGMLSSRVDGRLAVQQGIDSDLIQITVEHPDPVLAAKIANAWAVAYERLVNDIYARPAGGGAAIQEDVERAKKAYDNGQEALIQFLTQSQVSAAQRQINEKARMLNVLQSARQSVISTTVSLQTNANVQLYAAYLDAQSGNQLLAFQKEQERKRALVGAYIDAQTQAQLSVFSRQVRDRQRILNDAYKAKARNDEFLLRARILRDMAQQGGDAGSTALALALLKADIVGALNPGEITPVPLVPSTEGRAGAEDGADTGTQGSLAAAAEAPPVLLNPNSTFNLDLTIQSISEMTPADLVADTQALVAAIETQQTELDALIERQSQILLSDEGLRLPETVQNPQLARLIQETYPTLFEPGELSQVSTTMANNTPLSQMAMALAGDLLKLRDRQQLLSFSAENTPLDQAINNLEREIRTLEAQVERDTSREDELRRARNLAFETYTTLARKAAELKLADQLPGTEVRFAAMASVPTRANNDRERQLNMVVAAILGGLLGLVLSFGREFLVPAAAPRRVWGPPQAFWNRAIHWVLSPSVLAWKARKAGEQSFAVMQGRDGLPSDLPSNRVE